MLKAFDQHARRLLAQIRLPFMGRITAPAASPQVAGLNGEIYPDTPVMAHIGFVSGLPLDAEVIMLPLMGKSARSVIIGSRGGSVVVTVSAGETCIYDQFGHQIHLGATGIRIVGNVEVIGALKAATLSDSTGNLAAIRSAFNTHTGHVPNGTPIYKMGD
ncbi:MAG: hypothetical protein RLY58_529 [Pseudomonadota bacterium]|jgi:phage gp45-like